MYNLLLGNLRHHCRDVWGMDIKTEDGEGNSNILVPLTSGPTDAELSNRYRVIRTGTNKQLAKLPVPVLQHFCREFNQFPKKQRQMFHAKPLSEMLRLYVCTVTPSPVYRILTCNRVADQ